MRIQLHTLAAAMFASLALLAAGCDQPNRGSETTGQKIDRAADKMAAATKDATAKAANATDDAAVTTKVKAALFAEPGLKTLQINVVREDAIVTLKDRRSAPSVRQVRLRSRLDRRRAPVATAVIKTS
jgi:osmotically-inducible protein OsmY